MRSSNVRTRIVLVVLAALLALPVAQTASPVTAKPRARIVTNTYGNLAAINLPTSDLQYPMSADRYPATIRVDGPKRAKIRDVNLTLNGLEHTYPDDVYAVLVAPGGQTAIVMASVGGSTDIDDVTLTLDDEAAAPLPDETTLQSGAFRPTNVLGSIDFNDPGPTANANAALSVFDSGDPNGAWRFFVMDGTPISDPGAFTGGWTLEITAKVKARKRR